MQSTDFLHKVVRCLLYLIAGAMPLFFLPFTLEVLELNKHFFLYGFVLIAVLLWLLDGSMRKKFVINRTPFDIAIGVYLLAVLISGIFSTDRVMSFLGDYNTIQVGVLPLLFLIAYIFLLVQTCKSERQLLMVLGTFYCASGLAALIFFLGRWNLFSLSQFGVTIQNTVSLSNAEFGLLLSLLLMVSCTILMFKKDSFLIDVWSSVIGLIAIVDIISLGFKSVYILLAIGLAIILAFVLTRADSLRLGWITAVFAMLIASVLFIFLGSPRFTIMKSIPLEISLGVSESGSIAWNALTSGTKNFLFGSGPSTFVYDFSKFKPLEMNTNPIAWKVRFGKPYASVISIVAETGVVGTLAFLFMALITFGHIGMLWMKSISEKQKDTTWNPSSMLMTVVSPVWLTLFIALFFVHISITLWFLFWLLTGTTAAYVLMIKNDSEPLVISLKSSPQYVLATSFAVVILFACGVLFGVFAGRFYAAEVQYMHAIKSAKSPVEQITMLKNATELNSYNPRYFLGLAQAFLNEARRTTGDANAKPEFISSLVASAVNAAHDATTISPRNVATWETLSTMYLNASSFVPNIGQYNSSALESAVALEPTNPELRLRLGSAKYGEGKKSEAKEQFNEALRLKVNYLDAYIALAQYYDGEGDFDRSLIELQKGLGYGGRQDPNYLFQIGRVHFNRNKQGDWDIARASFALALQINPNHTNSLFSAGVLADRQGRRDEAISYFESVVKLDPKNPSIETVLKRLRQLKAVQDNQ